MIAEKLKQKSAVIVVDFQNDYVHEEGSISKVGLGTKKLQEAIPKMEKFLNVMRKSVPVIHMQMTEGPGEIANNIADLRNMTFGDAENWRLCEKGSWGYQLVLTPEKEDRVFEKNTYDSLSSMGLLSYLKSNNIKTLIICGGYTHNCVDSTVRSAVTHGFDVVLVKDLVGAPDKLQELHDAALRMMIGHFAFGADSNEILEMKGGITEND